MHPKLTARAINALTQIGGANECSELIRLHGWARLLMRPKIGRLTALEVTAFLMSNGLLAWEDVSFLEKTGLAERIAFNTFLRNFGWAGLFLPEENQAELRRKDCGLLERRRLIARRSRLIQELARIDAILEEG